MCLYFQCEEKDVDGICEFDCVIKLGLVCSECGQEEFYLVIVIVQLSVLVMISGQVLCKWIFNLDDSSSVLVGFGMIGISDMYIDIFSKVFWMGMWFF